MKITSASTTSRSAIRKKTTATETALYLVTENGITFLFRYDKSDKKTADDNDTVLVSAKGLRFKRYELEAAEVEEEETPAPDPVQPSPTPVEQVPAPVQQPTPATHETVPVVSDPGKVDPGQLKTSGKRIQGFSTFTTTGSMEAGSDVLELLEAIFEIGDTAAVCIGGEVGGGRRTTVGVGGGHINRLYSSKKEMDADKSQPAGTWATVIGQTGIYRYYDTWQISNYGPAPDALIPYSLIGKVVDFLNKERTLVRLDKKAAVATTGAKVVVDCSQVMFEYVRNRADKAFDATALGFDKDDTLYFQRVKWEGQYWSPVTKDWFYPTNIHINLGGMTFASIPGAFPCSFGVEYGNGDGNFLLENGTIIQNGTYEGMGVPRDAAFGMPQANETGENVWLYCPAFGGWTMGAVARNVTVINPNAYAFIGNAAENCHIIFTKEANKQYNGWPYLVFNLKNCTFYSPFLMRCAEIEASIGSVVDGLQVTNGILASNSSINPTFRNIEMRFTKDAAYGNEALLANPAFEIHAHIKGYAENVVVDGLKMIYEDYIDEQGGLLRDFNIKPGVNGVTLRNVEIIKPPVLQPYGRGNGYASSVSCGSDKLLLENFTTNGRMGPGFACEGQGRDNAQFDIRGAGSVLRKVKGQFAIVPSSAVLEGCDFSCPVVRKD